MNEPTNEEVFDTMLPERDVVRTIVNELRAMRELELAELRAEVRTLEHRCLQQGADPS